jgi:hypothetical protein
MARSMKWVVGLVDRTDYIEDAAFHAVSHAPWTAALEARYINEVRVASDQGILGERLR